MGVIILLFLFPCLLLTFISMLATVIYIIKTTNKIGTLNNDKGKMFAKNTLFITLATTLPAYLYCFLCPLFYSGISGENINLANNVEFQRYLENMTCVTPVTNLIIPILGIILIKLYSKREGMEVKFTTLSIIPRALLIIGGSGFAFLAAFSVLSNLQSIK